MTEIFIPKTGMYDSDVELIEWLANEGDHVEVGDSICLIGADKAEIELEAPSAGYLRQLVQPPAELEVGTVIGLIARTTEEYRSLLTQP